MAVATHLFHTELRHLPTHGLRAASSSQVLAGLGQVFAVEQGDCSAGDWSSLGQEVPRVDVFVSQSWSAGRWQKTLGLCYHLNYTLAVIASMFTYVAASVMLLLHAGSVSQLAGSPWIYPLTVDLPLTVFFLMFFFGHVLTCGCLSPSIWVDKLCIPQGDEAIKQKYVRALPDFVQRCSTMLVLWDSTYFERLFCNMELAVFLKYQSGRHLVVLPLWLPPWLLLAVLFDWVSVRCLVFRLLCWAQGFFLNLPLPASYPHLEALLRVLLYTLVTGCAYLPAGVAAAISFSMKLKQHGEMLERLASFDVRYAKCTIGADRPIIEATIAQLYDEIDDLPISAAVEAPEVAAAVSRQESAQLLANAEILRDPSIRSLTSYPDQEESLDAFNMEVRGQLRAEVIRQSGSATSLPLSVCMQAFAPLFFHICSSCFLDCDGLGGCAAALKSQGFDSFRTLILVDIANLFFSCLSLSIIFPCILHAQHWGFKHTRSPCAHACFAAASTFLAYFYAFALLGINGGNAVALGTRGATPTWLLWTLSVGAFSALQWFLIFYNQGTPTPASSCRALICDTKPTGME